MANNPFVSSFNKALEEIFDASKKVPASETKTGELVIIKLSDEKDKSVLYNVCSVRRAGRGQEIIKFAVGTWDYPENTVEFDVKPNEMVVLLSAQSDDVCHQIAA